MIKSRADGTIPSINPQLGHIYVTCNSGVLNYRIWYGETDTPAHTYHINRIEKFVEFRRWIANDLPLEQAIADFERYTRKGFEAHEVAIELAHYKQDVYRFAVRVTETARVEYLTACKNAGIAPEM